MSDPVTALTGATFDGFVKVEDAGLVGMITLRGDLADPALRTAVTKTTGCDMPGSGRITRAKDRSVAWMSPDELLLIGPYDKVSADLLALGKALKSSHVLLANVSDARAVIRLTGDNLREALAKLTPADMSDDAFNPGQIRRSRLAQAAAAFWMTSETSAEIVCFRSVAHYVFELFKTATIPGSEVGYL